MTQSFMEVLLPLQVRDEIEEAMKQVRVVSLSGSSRRVYLSWMTGCLQVENVRLL